MVGQIPTCGTGDSTVLLNEDLLDTQEDIEEEDVVDINKYFESSEYCENADIKFSISDINGNQDDYNNFPEVIVE